MQPIQNTNKATQRKAILEALRKGRLSTIQFREELGICSPASRVRELRERGYKIDTSYRNERDSAGVSHRIGVYSLISEPEKAA